jgi:membrane-associated phospholipid phosphatase
MQKFLELDARLSTNVRVAERPGWLHRFMAVLAHSGDSWFLLLALVLLYFIGPVQWHPAEVLMVVGIVVTAMVVMAIKFSVRRRRPEGEWGSIYRSTDPHSFPSGHAARVMMLAVLAFGFGAAGLGVVELIWAVLVAFARVTMGVHYLSDVLAGMLLGLLMGLLISAV